MKIHKDIKNRVKWFQDLYFEILEEVKDIEIAKIIYRRVLYEER